ncbi:MAG TPA: chitobiase/beta-hexosaminidase C-terminal domain-containing protein [Cytophagaceae bacterium]
MKPSLLFIPIILLTFFQVKAQQPLTHKKKIYIDKNKRLYVQDSLPVYLFLSTSPDGKDAVQLQSETTPKYVNPMHFDGHGKHNLIHKDYEHEVEITFEVYSDGLPPKSACTPSDGQVFVKNNKKFASGKLKINLSASDDMSGVENIYYSINGSEFTIYNGPITADKEQEYNIKYYAVDNVGNVEKIKSETYIVDLSSPTSTHHVKGDIIDNIVSERARIELSSEDQLTGVGKIYYSIDGGTEKLYSSPILLHTLSEGEHTIKYYGVDNLNNKENIKEYTFYLDKTGPIVAEEILGDRFIANGKEFSSGRTKIKLTAVDNKAGIKAVYYSINGGEFQLYTEPFYVPNKSGALIIRSYAVDNVMNKSINSEQTESRINASYIDLTGPELEYTFKGPLFTTRDTTFISSKTQIQLKGKDLESGLYKITYNLNKKGEKDYVDGFIIEEQGTHVIDFFGYDNVNNSNKSNFYFFVDNTGPQIYTHFSILPIGKNINADVYPAHVGLFLSATDAYVGYEKMYYSINDGPEVLYTGMINKFQKGKSYKLKIRALDKLGNETVQDLYFETEGFQPKEAVTTK